MLLELLNFVKSLGKTSIEVYEWREMDVRKMRLPNAPDFSKFTTQQPSMTFNGLSLAHAVVKADYLDRRNLTMPGIGFLLQAGNLIDFGAVPIELKQGASKILNDFSLTSLAGRAGQGMAILYGQSLGMKFTAHLRSHVESLPAGSQGSIHKNKAMADFLFANNQHTILIESKGSFRLEKNDPTGIKSVLKGALLNQIDPWMTYLNPTPHNGYVVYSCLREKSWQPSALFVVDPEGGENQASEVPFSLDQVRRENYGAWLRAMGLNNAAHRLVKPSIEHPPSVDELFLIQEFNGRPYAFPRRYYPRYYGEFWLNPVIGIDLMVLRAISSIIRAPNATNQELLVDLPEGSADNQDETSIFPDGSILVSTGVNPSDMEIVRL